MYHAGKLAQNGGIKFYKKECPIRRIEGSSGMLNIETHNAQITHVIGPYWPIIKFLMARFIYWSITFKIRLNYAVMPG
jgi:hypothetical protein